MKQFLIFHPFLFAVFPILFLFAHNIDEVPATDLFLPLIVAVVATLILLLIPRLITKNYNKIAIIISTILILFFSYGHVRDLIYSYFLRLGGETRINILLLLLWGLIFITVTYMVIKSRKDFSIFTRFLNVAAITLVAISLINIGVYEIRKHDLIPEKMDESHTGLESSHNLPDIYYIILDEYARVDTLNEFWGYDNSEFIDYLTSRGFYVASESRSNCHGTILSLPTCLNMKYINDIVNSTSPQDQTMLLVEMIANSEVSQFLKSNGYRYIFISDIGIGKNMQEYAEVLMYKGVFGI